MGTLEYLLYNAANPDAIDKNDFTPLHVVLLQGTPLLYSTAKDNDKMVNILLDYNADPDMNYNEVMYGQFITPLVVSVLNGSMKCTELLIQAGADVNKQPVLEMALGSIELMNYLLKAGADPHMPNKYKKLPIEVAAIRGLKEVVEILFPLTFPIQTVTDWSVEGLFTHVESENFKSREKIRSWVKIAKLKQVIEELMNKHASYVTARYLCFYALQENPIDFEVLAYKTFCRMEMENNICDC